jgi:hypothetical protein
MQCNAQCGSNSPLFVVKQNAIFTNHAVKFSDPCCLTQAYQRQKEWACKKKMKIKITFPHLSSTLRLGKIKNLKGPIRYISYKFYSY